MQFSLERDKTNNVFRLVRTYYRQILWITVLKVALDKFIENGHLSSHSVLSDISARIT